VNRNGTLFQTQEMAPAPGGDYRTGKVYRTSLRIDPTGTYRYRCRFADASGAAVGPGSKWCAGPIVSRGATSSVCALTAVSTAAARR